MDLAERNLNVSSQQALSSVIQTFATVATFFAAVFAAIFARGAVVEGRRSANTAREALDDSRATSLEQAERFDRQHTVAALTANAAQTSADAAQVSARAAQDSEVRGAKAFRPYVFIENVVQNYDRWRNPPHEAFRWEFRIINHGRTPAIIDHAMACVCLSDVEPPSQPIFDAPRGVREHVEMSSEPLTSETVLPPDAQMVFSRESLRGATGPKRALGVSLDLTFWLVAKIVYRDVAGEPYETNAQLRVDRFNHVKSIGEERNKRT